MVMATSVTMAGYSAAPTSLACSAWRSSRSSARRSSTRPRLPLASPAGELTKVRSSGPGAEVFELSPDQYTTHLGDKCPKGYQLRPHIVWFGEAVPEIDNAIHITGQADVFVVIGTSLNVYPAAGLLHYVPRNTPVFLIDPNEVMAPQTHITVIKKGAGEGMKELTELLKAYR